MSEDKISSQMERILEIRRQLEALLPKEGLDREELIKALGQICPGKSAGELAHACEKMEQGIRNGSAELKYYMEVKDLDVLLEDKLKECTAQLTDAQKRGFLMSLYQIFHKDLEYADLSGEMARFLAEMPEEDLQEGLHELLKGEAAILASREMEQFLKAAQESLTEEEFQPSGQRTQEEEWLLTAASIYAGSVNGESDAGLALYPEMIGKNVGAQGQAVTAVACLGEERTAETVEMILLVLEILAIVVVFYASCFGVAAFAEVLYNFLIAESASEALMVLYGIGLAVLGTAGTFGAVWGVSQAFEKLEEFAEQTAVPRAHAVFRRIKEQVNKTRKAKAQKAAEKTREQKEKQNAGSAREKQEKILEQEILEENWDLDEEDPVVWEI